ARYAHVLSSELGIAKGERVAVQVEKSPQALFLYLACLRAGLIYFPLNTAYPRAELDYFLGDAEPQVFICAPQTLPMAQELAIARNVPHVYTLDADGSGSWTERCQSAQTAFDTVVCQADDTATLLYTSGTTGRPKGAMLSHGNLAANSLTLHHAWGWQDGDVLLHALPLFHAHGLFVACHCALLNGSSMLFLPKFEARALMNWLPQATVFMGVPTYYTRLLAEADFGRQHCANMRLFISGSAPLLEQTFTAFQERTGHTILERYGMTETVMNISNPLNGPRHAGTVGLPLPGVSIRIIDDQGNDVDVGHIGRLLVKGDNVFKAYWRRPEKTAEEFTTDGYFITGDLALRDEDGYITLVGRSKDLIITGGYNVYPKEVERCIDLLDGVIESAVIGVPHNDYGEAVVAVVVKDKDRADVTDESLRVALETQLGGYKIPKRIIFTAELPRNAMGKVLKNVLRDEYCYQSAVGRGA
ncbi:MAG: AMP-binding protein, partial [Candidatus Competibacteraceae bacterium]|nr:AMP-binding protein [Candidatus Competibacteraceae bacterium]